MQYKTHCLRYVESIEAKLTELANQGWEFVSMIWDGTQYVLVFKRR